MIKYAFLKNDDAYFGNHHFLDKSLFWVILSKPQPNHNSTQRNLNWGWVWHDYHFSHPPTTHRNSTSTINNDPMGLKFCRRPYQAKLTTIKHNFNPTIFWGGGSYILHLGLTLPVFLDKKNFRSKSFDQTFFAQNFFTQNIFSPKIFMTEKNFDPKFFWPPNLFPKFLLTQNIFLTQKVFLTRNFFDPKIFLTQVFLTQNFFWP